MYIVHVVQAHANVRPRSQRCSPVAAHGIRSRHTWWSCSREPSIIYVPPTEHGVLYKAGSTLYGTPSAEQVVGQDHSADASHNSISIHPHHTSPHAITVPPIRPASTAPKLQRAAGVLTKMLKSWDRPKTLVQVRPAGSSMPAAAAGAGATAKALAGQPACSNSSSMMQNSGHCSVLASGVVIYLPDGSSLISSEHGSSGSGSGATDLAAVLPAAVLPAAVQPAAVQPRRQPRADVLLHHTARLNNSKHLIRLIDATSSSSSKGRMLAPATADAATAVLPSQLKVSGTLQYKAVAPPPATTWAHHPSSSSSSSNAGVGAWRAPSSSSSITASPAFSIPGSGTFDQGPSSVSSNRFGVHADPASGSSGRGGAGRPGSAAAAAAAAAAGGKSSNSAFGALPLESLKVARMGVALMGLAAAAAVAVAFTADSEKYSRHSDMPGDGDDGCTTGKKGVNHSSSSSSSSSSGTLSRPAAAAGDTPGFHEWMVQRLQTTLQQFDAERDLLLAELEMLQTLRSSKVQRGAGGAAAAAGGGGGSSAAVQDGSRTTAATAGAAAGGGMWSRLRRWYSSSSSSSSAAAPQATIAAASSAGTAALTPAAIAVRIAEIQEQIESLDVLKSALTAELVEQQRQLQQQQQQQQ